ncbi:MAG: hypothetical protein D6678_08295 [Zetaproteobacteria bacterium]|nr:MAG: hypothetical protein D6678_08295 [Zetaproteobacteria bacterium]
MSDERERILIEALQDPKLPDWVGPHYEKELDWIRRGRPKDELIPEHIAERMTGEAALGGGAAWDEEGNKDAEW